MKYISILFFLVLFGSPTIGSASSAAIDAKTKHIQLSINAFLSSALHDPVLSLQDERIRHLEDGPGGVSFMEDPEVSVTIDKFENNEQEYAIQFKPKGWGEIKGQKTLQDAMVQSGQIQRDSLLHFALPGLSGSEFAWGIVEACLSKELTMRWYP